MPAGKLPPAGGPRLFDDLVRLAARVARVPTAVVSLTETERAWLPAAPDPEPRSDVTLGEAVLLAEHEVEVADTREDPRFDGHPLAADGLPLAFYAGFPLRREGRVVGTLSVLGDTPYVLDDDQRDGLRVLARQVMTQLELQECRRVEVELAASRREYRLLAEHSGDIISRHTAEGRVTYVSPAVRRVLGYEPADEIAENAVNHVHPEDEPRLGEALGAVSTGGTSTVTVRCEHADGSWRHLEITLSPFVDDSQAVVEVYSSARDVTDRVSATEHLERALELSRAVLDSIAVGVVACDADGHLTLFNPATREFHGMTEDAHLGPEHWADHYALYEPDGRTVLAQADVPLRRALLEGRVDDAEIVIAPHGLPARLVNCNGQALRAPDGTVTGAVVAMTDITATREAERRLRAAHDALRRSNGALARSEAQFRDIFENGPMAMCRLDNDGVLRQVNPALRRLIALPTEAILGRRLTTFALPTERERLALAVADAGAGAGAATHLVEARLCLPHGRDLWCEIALSAGADDQGATGVLVQLADIDARKRRELDLERRAAHDELTQLPNRAALHQHLQGLLRGADLAPVAALYLDLDNFKSINDTLGHQVGDEVLVEVARRLQSVVRAGDLVARLGGDEFVILRRVDPGTSPSVAMLVERVRTALTDPVGTSAGPQQVGLSIGVATSTTGEDASGLLARADSAMYEDKRQVRRSTAVPSQRREPAAPRDG